jgi:hypothetical protein
MPRPLRTLPLALALVALSAGAALAFNPLPDEAGPGLQRAIDASGRALPSRPASLPTAVERFVASVAEAADAAAHGAAVAAAAQAEDTTPDTNHGEDVSAVARDNHGQATAAEHKPAYVGKPDGAGKPEGAGKPDALGIPADPGAPEGAGGPDGVGRP